MRKIVVGVTGASGSIYAARLFAHLERRAHELEVGVVFSKNARDVWRHELGEEPNPPFKVYRPDDYFAPFASGSAQYKDMFIVPCSMGTLGRIAHGISDDLITRAADVILKERRRLICVVRDAPYNLIHLENMLTVTRAGGIILPASPSFYSRPNSFEQLADTVVARLLDLAGLELPATFRWSTPPTDERIVRDEKTAF
ncbi:MAG: UbiX family flavin prenyltransferase [Bacteroidia bacterium]|nr:UbiX family flavin prenyltransferase [Bacteroidia bacterium]